MNKMFENIQIMIDVCDCTYLNILSFKNIQRINLMLFLYIFKQIFFFELIGYGIKKTNEQNIFIKLNSFKFYWIEIIRQEKGL